MFMMYLSLKPFVTFTFCTSSLLLLAIMSQVIILFCVVSDCHWLTWGIDETMRVSMIQMMSKWRTPNSESMFSESDSMCINGCMFCSIDVMKCIQALAWFCFLRFLLLMQHIYLFVYFWVFGEFWVTWFFMLQFQIWCLAIPQPVWKPCKQNPQCRSPFVFVCLGLWVSRNWGNFKMNCGGKGNRRHCRSSCCCMESLVSNTRLGVSSLNWLDIFFTRVNWIDLFLSAPLLGILLVGVLKHKSFWCLSSFLWKGCCICDHLHIYMMQSLRCSSTKIFRSFTESN